MKYIIVDSNADETVLISSNKKMIYCVDGSSLSDKNGDPLDYEELYFGNVLGNNCIKCADIYWYYSVNDYKKLSKKISKLIK